MIFDHPVFLFPNPKPLLQFITAGRPVSVELSPLCNSYVVDMLELVNQDYNASVNMTEFAFDIIYPLELAPERLTALMKLPAAKVIHTNSLPTSQKFSGEKSAEKYPSHWRGIEALVLEGECSIDGDTHKQGCYIRIPDLENQQLTAVTVSYTHLTLPTICSV